MLADLQGEWLVQGIERAFLKHVWRWKLQLQQSAFCQNLWAERRWCCLELFCSELAFGSLGVASADIGISLITAAVRAGWICRGAIVSIYIDIDIYAFGGYETYVKNDWTTKTSISIDTLEWGGAVFCVTTAIHGHRGDRDTGCALAVPNMNFMLNYAVSCIQESLTKAIMTAHPSQFCSCDCGVYQRNPLIILSLLLPAIMETTP